MVAFVASGALLALGALTIPRLSILRNAIRTSGRVVDHHLTPAKTLRCILFVELPAEWQARIVSVDVDSETYDQTWIGDRATFYIDATHPTNTSEDPPSTWKLAGFVGSSVAFGLVCLVSFLFLAWDLLPEQKEERRRLRELPSAVVTVTEVTSIGESPVSSIVSGSYVDAEAKRWKVHRLSVPSPTAVGDRITILYDHENKTFDAIGLLTAFEPSPLVARNENV